MSRRAIQVPNYARVATREHGGSQSAIVAKRLKITLAAAMFAGLALSLKLWLSDRVYPLTPVLPFLPPIPAPLDLILYAAVLISLVLVALAHQPAKYIGAFAALALVLALCDQSRWQPWFYQYLVMLGALVLYYRSSTASKDGDHPSINVCRLVIVCTYFWSGLQKAQPSFMFHVFPWMIAPFIKWLPPTLARAANSFGMAGPIIEAAIGIGLLIPRVRRYAIFAGIGMHAFILLALGPLGENFNRVVWPWNVAMVMFLLILFWKPSQRSVRAILWPHSRYHVLVLLLFGIAPALNFVGFWDTELSSAMYTGQYRYDGVFYVTNALADRLPKEILQHVYVSPKPGINTIEALNWSMAEVHATLYPEPRIYKSLGKYICSYAHNPAEMRLVIKRRHVLFSADQEVSYTCSDVMK